MKNLIKNFFYQSIFQVVKIIMPIITIPIVSNALGPRGIGIYNYTFSIAQYFVLFAGLGVTLYGNREIALVWNRKGNVSLVFWEIVIFKFFSSLLCIGMYIIFASFFDQRIYMYAQLMTIVAVVFDISWFFMGIEDFKKTSMSNLVIQLIVLICIILFIKNEKDTVKYILIQSGGLLISQMFIWKFIFRYIKIIPVKLKNCFKHFKGSVEYFIPQIAITLYTNLNKTLLGVFLGSIAVGYYSNSQQLNSVFVTIITTVDLVLLPYMTGFFATNNTKKIEQTLIKTIHLQLYFSIPIMFGLLTVYDKLVPWFFGKKFLFINNVIPYFSILIVIIPLGISMSRQYLIPVGKTKEYNLSVMIGAAINIILSFLLLPTIGFFGSVISNVVAEFFVTFTRSRSIIKNTIFNFNMKIILTYSAAGLIMCIFTRYLTKSLPSSLLTNIIQVCIAVPIYIGLTTMFGTSPIKKILSILKS